MSLYSYELTILVGSRFSSPDDNEDDTDHDDNDDNYQSSR